MGLFARKISSYFQLWKALTRSLLPQLPQLPQLFQLSLLPLSLVIRPHALTPSLLPPAPLPPQQAN